MPSTSASSGPRWLRPSRVDLTRTKAVSIESSLPGARGGAKVSACDYEAVDPQARWDAGQGRQTKSGRPTLARNAAVDADVPLLRRARNRPAAAGQVRGLLSRPWPGGVSCRIRDGARSGARLDRAAIPRADRRSAPRLSAGA